MNPERYILVNSTTSRYSLRKGILFSVTVYSRPYEVSRLVVVAGVGPSLGLGFGWEVGSPGVVGGHDAETRRRIRLIHYYKET
jgi:hypothetical protein